MKKQYIRPQIQSESLAVSQLVCYSIDNGGSGNGTPAGAKAGVPLFEDDWDEGEDY